MMMIERGLVGLRRAAPQAKMAVSSGNDNVSYVNLNCKGKKLRIGKNYDGNYELRTKKEINKC